MKPKEWEMKNWSPWRLDIWKRRKVLCVIRMDTFMTIVSPSLVSLWSSTPTPFFLPGFMETTGRFSGGDFHVSLSLPPPLSFHPLLQFMPWVPWESVSHPHLSPSLFTGFLEETTDILFGYEFVKWIEKLSVSNVNNRLLFSCYCSPCEGNDEPGKID